MDIWGLFVSQVSLARVLLHLNNLHLMGIYSDKDGILCALEKRTNSIKACSEIVEVRSLTLRI